jgi:hypothetical protein
MKLSKKDRRIINNCIGDMQYQINKLWDSFLRQAEATRLDTIEILLDRIEEILNGKRRPARGVQETRGAR